MSYIQPFREAAKRAWRQTVPAVYGLDEMLEFAAHEFCETIEYLDGLIAHHREKGNNTLTDEGASYILRVFSNIDKKCQKIGLDSVSDYMNETNHTINQGVSCAVIMERCSTIRRLIYSELRHSKFVYIRKDKTERLEKFEDEWEKVLGRFDSVRKDARDATEAYALELNNACVFHAIMVLEKGLAALAKTVGVRYGRDTWGTIIENIEKKLLEVPPEKCSIFAEAAKEFTYFRIAWRNHVAHGRANYDEKEAGKVITHVRDFMTTISRFLSDTDYLDAIT